MIIAVICRRIESRRLGISAAKTRTPRPNSCIPFFILSDENEKDERTCSFDSFSRHTHM